MIGEIIPYGGSTVPEGFLACDGSAVSRDDYAELFAVIGTTWGSGDGSTTFNLPDMSGKVGLGVSSGYTLASSGGTETVTIGQASMPSHSHTIPQHTHANTLAAKTPSLSHTVSTQPSFKYTRLDSTHEERTGSTRTAYSTRSSSSSMSQSTNMSVTAHAATACTVSGSITNCAAMTSGSAGSGGAHNNMMPYLALTYIIRAMPETPPQPRMLVFNGCMPVTAQGYYLVGTRS